MTKAFESIKAGLKEAMAHRQNKPNTVVVHHAESKYVSGKRVYSKRNT